MIDYQSLNARLLSRQPHRQFRETLLLTVDDVESLRESPRPLSRPRLIGYSRSADRTFFVIPELQIGLDAGEVRGSTLGHVFLTHTHSDHSLDVFWFAVCREAGCDVFVPAPMADHTLRYIVGTLELNLCRPLQVPEELSRLRLRGVAAGETLQGVGRGKDWEAVVFDCVHSVPCVGYAFLHKKKVRKAEYQGLPAQRMKELRQQGVQFEEIVSEKRFVYVGDTSIQVFSVNPWLLEYPIIIIECTFLQRQLDGVDLQARCERDGHIIFEDSLEKVVRANPRVMFILIHFSLRYSVDEVEQYFLKNHSDLQNVRLHIGSMSDLGAHIQ